MGLLSSQYAVVAKYDLEVPDAEYLKRLDSKTRLDFIVLNCFPIHTELADEEETKESIFEEIEVPGFPDTTQVSEQLGWHSQNRSIRTRNDLQTDEEETRQTIFEECQFLDLSNAVQGGKVTSANVRDERVLRPQNTCIRIREPLRRVVKFLRLKLGCQKQF
ncbi:hypothetical protein NPIL_232811 [Nephila pilipes]|uniref:Uncharacterized protein n=1 Tax=Nephila pilipes TaxID=299642 RepID=A0A8X6PZU0_NEPPI|nr:hypothetical protein NPIL_232811 [Nephila pilipes]